MKKGDIIKFNKFSFPNKYGKVSIIRNFGKGEIIEIIHHNSGDNFRVILDEKYVSAASFISNALSRIVYVSVFDLV